MRFNLFNVKSSVCSMAGLKKITTGADPGFLSQGVRWDNVPQRRNRCLGGRYGQEHFEYEVLLERF